MGSEYEIVGREIVAYAKRRALDARAIERLMAAYEEFEIPVKDKDVVRKLVTDLEVEKLKDYFAEIALETLHISQLSVRELRIKAKRLGLPAYGKFREELLILITDYERRQTDSETDECQGH